MKKIFIFSIVLSFLLIINKISYSKVLWQKYYEKDSIAFGSMSYDNTLCLIENQLFLIFNGTYSGNSKFIATGFIVTDLYGNELNRYNIIREKNIMIRFIKEKAFNYHIISTYGYKDNDYIFMGKKVPHKLVLDKSFNIIEENCDTSNQSFYKGSWNFIFLQDDSIYVDNGIYNNKTGYYYDKITVLDLSTKFIREIDVDTLHQPNIWKSTNSAYFLVTSEINYLIVVSKSNRNTIEMCDLILLNKEGKTIWKKYIKYKDKLTNVYRVIENKDGDFIGLGKTLPNISDQELNTKDTSDIQRDSLIIFKVTKDGYLEWIKEYPLKNYTNAFYRIVELKNLESYIVYGSYIYKKDVANNRYQCYYALIDKYGNLTYQEYWTLDTNKDMSPLSVLCIGDTLLFYGGIGTNNQGIEYLFLSEVMPDYTSISSEYNGENKDITIYPNPASEYIEINPIISYHLLESFELKICNILGECVMTLNNLYSTQNQRVNISMLPKGVYFVRLGNKFLKFLKY